MKLKNKTTRILLSDESDKHLTYGGIIRWFARSKSAKGGDALLERHELIQKTLVPSINGEYDEMPEFERPEPEEIALNATQTKLLGDLIDEFDFEMINDDLANFVRDFREADEAG